MKTYTRRPESCPAVEAIQYTDDSSAQRIVAWVESVRGRGAAVYNPEGAPAGTLFLCSEEFGGKAIKLPDGWVVYREVLRNKFHTVPQDQFDQMYEARP